MLKLLPFKYCFISLFFLLITRNKIVAQSWTLAKDKNGVKIETRFIDGWSIKEYRATVFIKTSLKKAVEAYRDPVKRKKFMKRSIEVANLKVVSKNEIITYNLGNAPWPVLDRDNITHSLFSKPSENQIKITMNSLPNYINEKSNIVRIPRSKGFWLFTDMGNGKIKVVQQSVADLGGSVPDWVVNSTIVEGPYDTLLALKNFLQN
ncbi:MAG: START domain-containing protein [Saprospiraceae bacterium]|nr:START domain-containing protein [Saprospiraceae bacterium]